MNLFTPPVRFVVLYDGGCPICRRSVDWLMRRRGSDRLRPMALQTPGLLEALGVDEAAAMREIHVVAADGRVRRGADGVLVALAALPGWRWLGALALVPGALPAARFVYAQVAARRSRDACETGACRLD